MSAPDRSAAVAAKVDEIEAEMHAIGLWQASPLTADQLDFSAPFGADRMTFSQWLQFVFIPRVREAIEANRYPGSSSVGTQATREFDTDPRAGRLATLLAEFDNLFLPDGG